MSDDEPQPSQNDGTAPSPRLRSGSAAVLLSLTVSLAELRGGGRRLAGYFL